LFNAPKRGEIVNTEDQSNLSQNRLLSALSAQDYGRLAPDLELVALKSGEVLYRPEERIEYVYFPHHAVVSMVNIMEDGSQVEAGVIGNEGMVGTPLVLASNSSSLQAVVQVSDGGQRMAAEPFTHHLEHFSQFNRLLLRYTEALMTQISQTSACNRLHDTEERLARWLLQTQDRLKSDVLELTQEFIATMLGSRRASVTLAAGALQRAGLIRYKRGVIEVLDRPGLEETSCECYRTVLRNYTRLIGGF
jgi:CRP-like cAMP-binding protein